MTHAIYCDSVQNASPFFEYAEKHRLALFPLSAETKKPLPGSSGFYDGTTNRADWDAWLAQGHQLGISACLSNVVLIDVDAHGDPIEAWSHFTSWCTKIGIDPPSVYAHSPSGGWHFAFQCPDNFDPKKHRGTKSIKVSDFRTLAAGEVDFERISVRNRGYNVAPGSAFGGRPYLLATNAPQPQPYSEKTTALFDLLKSPEGSTITGPVPDAVDGVSHDGIRYADLCWWIPQKVERWMNGFESLGNDEWISLGKRIKLSFPGKDGLAAFLAMSWADQHEVVSRRWWNATDFKTEGEKLETLPALLKNDVTWMFRHVFGCPMVAPPLAPGPLPPGTPLPGPCEDYDEPSEPRELPVFSAASLEGLAVPPRRWHVRDWIPAETVTLLYGDGGTGKSLVALQLLASTALGRPWLGRTVERGVSLFLTAEDSRDEVHRRLNDIAREVNFSLKALTDLHIVSLAGEDAIMAAPDGRSSILVTTSLFAALEAQLEAKHPNLVVLDTLADLFGGNEIDRSQARQFIGLLRGLALKYNTTILVLAHPSVSGMTRGTGSSGSTGWNNSVRSRLYFDRIRADDNSEPDPDARVLRLMKSNYGRVGEEIVLHWRRGVFAPDSITTGGLMAAHDATTRADEAFLKLLMLYEAEGRGAVSPNPGSNYAPKVFADHAQAQGFKARALKGAMDRLLAAKRIETIMTGPPSRIRQSLVVSNRNYPLTNGATNAPTNAIPTLTNGVPTPLPTPAETLPTPC